MTKTSTYCEHCGKAFDSRFIRRHRRECPIAPENLKQILLWLKDFVDENSTFDEIEVIPEAHAFDVFAKAHNILRYQSVRKMFDERDWADIVIDLVTIGITNEVVTSDEFPGYHRSLYDNFLFLPEQEFVSSYKTLSNHEDRHLGYI